MGEAANRVLVVAVVVGVAVATGVGAGLLRRSPVEPPPVTAGSGPEETVTIKVHVAGWVAAPGVVTLEEGAIVAEAIDAAGGLEPGAATESVNLAAEVFPGDQIFVPGPGEGPVDGAAGAGSAALSLNGATAEELEELPGVGPVLAERIVSFRTSNGSFETVDDLLQVPGIGEAKLASIRDLVRP